MLGTGSAFAKKYYNNNALITVNGQRLLVDCGNTAPRALYESGLIFNDLDAILITHIHADHVGGLEELAYQMKFKFGRKPVLHVEQSLVGPLWDTSLRGGLEQEENRALEDYFDVRPLHAGVDAELLPDLRVRLIPTRHIPGKLNFSCVFNDFFYYSGDTVFDADLIHRLVDEQRIRLIFHDCQLSSPGVVHASLSQLLTLPERIQALTYLMHYGDDKINFEGGTGRMTFVEQHREYELEQLVAGVEAGDR